VNVVGFWVVGFAFPCFSRPRDVIGRSPSKAHSHEVKEDIYLFLERQMLNLVEKRVWGWIVR
jgi:hypothetical protein